LITQRGTINTFLGRRRRGNGRNPLIRVVDNEAFAALSLWNKRKISKDGHKWPPPGNWLPAIERIRAADLRRIGLKLAATSLSLANSKNSL
jgi:hypothetical protein